MFSSRRTAERSDHLAQELPKSYPPIARCWYYGKGEKSVQNVNKLLSLMRTVEDAESKNNHSVLHDALLIRQVLPYFTIQFNFTP